jgi:hypothetical protein
MIGAALYSWRRAGGNIIRVLPLWYVAMPEHVHLRFATPWHAGKRCRATWTMAASRSRI